MLTTNYQAEFKKDLRRVLRRGAKIEKFERVVEFLVNEKVLPTKYREHKLKGRYSGYSECHIEPDWLLMYKIEGGVLYLARTGTHSDLF